MAQPSIPMTYTAALTRSKRLLNKGDYDGAIRETNKAITIAPTLPDAYSIKAAIYSQLGNFDDALQAYSKGLLLTGSDVPSLALIYASRGLVWHAKGLHEKAVADYTRALELQALGRNGKRTRVRLFKQFTITLLHNRALAYESLERFDVALEDCNKGIMLANQVIQKKVAILAMLYSQRAVVYSRLERGDLAQADANQAISLGEKAKLKPSNWYLFLRRAVVHKNMGDYAAALADAKLAIELNKSLPIAQQTNAWSTWAEILAAQKDYEGAFKVFETALQMASIDRNRSFLAQVYQRRAQVYQEIGDNASTIKDLTAAIEANPQVTFLYRERAKAYKVIGDAALATADEARYKDGSMTQLLEPDENVFVRQNFGCQTRFRYTFIYVLIAIAILSIIYGVRSNGPVASPRSYIALGDEAYGKGDYKFAVEEYSRAIETGKSSALAYRDRGWSYFELKEYDQAIADFSQVITLEPDDADGYYFRGLAYTHLGQTNLANKDFRKALVLDPQHDDADWMRKQIGIDF